MKLLFFILPLLTWQWFSQLVYTIEYTLFKIIDLKSVKSEFLVKGIIISSNRSYTFERDDHFFETENENELIQFTISIKNKNDIQRRICYDNYITITSNGNSLLEGHAFILY